MQWRRARRRIGGGGGGGGVIEVVGEVRSCGGQRTWRWLSKGRYSELRYGRDRRRTSRVQQSMVDEARGWDVHCAARHLSSIRWKYRTSERRRGGDRERRRLCPHFDHRSPRGRGADVTCKCGGGHAVEKEELEERRRRRSHRSSRRSKELQRTEDMEVAEQR